MCLLPTDQINLNLNMEVSKYLIVMITTTNVLDLCSSLHMCILSYSFFFFYLPQMENLKSGSMEFL